ncbi:hypothetical protein HZA43_00960 [Candidatus Peregrinibacteria bacterium]|nr:hypothetical protein [Candidatus Peregrinibacteria bacterium]
MKNCAQCSSPFENTDADRQFCKELDVPEPTQCWTCRQQQRLAFRNERNLYHRTCDSTGKRIVSMYSADKPLVVYDREAWWSDYWSGTDYARDFDFNRPFFEQFAELQKVVPRVGIVNVATVNSDYINYAGYSKNSYLIFGSVQAEDCFYGSPYYSKDCVDVERLTHSELCYKCIDSKNLYNGIYLQDSSGCSGCVFGFDLHGCHDCFGCVGLRQKEYYIFNKSYSAGDYHVLVKQFHLNDRQHFDAAKKRFDELVLKSPRISAIILKSEDCVGHHIYESHNCYYGFYLERCDDCRYVNWLMDSKKCLDYEYGEELQWCAYSVGGYRLNNVKFSMANVESHDLLYSDQCFSCHDCFGCIGLRHKQYCIFNKPYSKENYFNLKSLIINHMGKTGEWGQFFPIKYSPYAYNETMAHEEYYPLTREEVLKRDWKWRDAEPEKPIENVIFDPSIHECQKCRHHFRLIPAEVVFYKKMGITEPVKCPLCRYHKRIKLRNPRRLFTRPCAKCSVPMQTTYFPDRPEIIYCEKCYLKEVY